MHLRTFVIVACTPLLAFSQPSQWSWRNPLPQGNSLGGVSLLPGNTIVAVGELSTVMRSTDGGLGWTVRSRVGGTTVALHAVAFTDSSTGFAVGDNGTILKTTDNGLSWHHTSSGVTGTLRAISFSSNAGAIVGDGGTILWTTDGGDSWLVKPSGTDSTIFGVCVINAELSVAVGVAGMILRSTDSGQSWTRRSSGTLLWLYGVAFGNPRKGIAVGKGNMTVRTTDGGETWTPAFEYPPGTNLYSISFLDSNTAIAAGSVSFFFGNFGFFMRTTDCGLNWASRSGGGSPGLRCVAMNPGSANGTAVGLYGSIVNSANSGLDWTSRTIGTNQTLFSVVTHRDTSVAVGDEGVILITKDGGVTWSQTSAPAWKFFDVARLSSGVYVAVGSFGAIAKSSDAGVTWSSKPGGTSYDLNSICFPTPSTGIAVGESGTIRQTTDGGETWIPRSSGTAQDLRAVTFLDSLRGFVVGDGGALLRTSNGGNGWVSVGGMLLVPLNDIAFANSSIGFIVGASGVLYRTSDGGNTWNLISLGASVDLNCVRFRDTRKGIIVGDGGRIFSTSNGGLTWDAQEHPTTNSLYGISFGGNDEGFIVGQGGTILTSNVGYEVVEVRISGSWNLVSLPIDGVDAAMTNLFPSATSAALRFNGGYITDDTLKRGIGYWMRYPAPETVRIGGNHPIESDTIQVRSGWNLIGSISREVPINEIQTIPPNLIISNIFGFSERYVHAASIVPGKGYWLKTSDSGAIVLSGGSLARSGWRIALESDWMMESNSVVVSDELGNATSLYFCLSRRKENLPLEQFELPPLPAPGAFDARFASGRMLEIVADSRVADFPIQLQAETFPLTVRILPKAGSEVMGILIIDGVPHSSSERGTPIVVRNPLTSIVLRVISNTSSADAYEFAVGQNYPNPFNSATRITYELPVAGQVSLHVYNIVGQRTATLIDGPQVRGRHTIDFMAEGLASGVYVYRLQAGDFMQERRMVILR